MMQKVVLEGTGRKAILEGYTSAGKTGTAQKVDPATGAYSKTKYIGSFAGFAPVNNPQIVVAVILDSAVGLHQGGQVSAPGFQTHFATGARIPARAARSAAGAAASVAAGAGEDERERSGRRHARSSRRAARDGGSEQHDFRCGEAENVARAPHRPRLPKQAETSCKRRCGSAPPQIHREPRTVEIFQRKLPTPEARCQKNCPSTGTVVLDVEQGGIEVPSFVGKTVRGAVEAAQDIGLNLKPSAAA